MLTLRYWKIMMENILWSIIQSNKHIFLNIFFKEIKAVLTSCSYNISIEKMLEKYLCVHGNFYDKN